MTRTPPNNDPISPLFGYDPTSHKFVAIEVGATQIDGRVTYAPITATNGGVAGTQYTDAASTPTHPIGNALVFDSSGSIVAASATHPFPVTPPVVQADSIVLASASRTTTQTQADQTNSFARGIRVVLDMTDVSASPSVTLEIDAKDPASGKYVSLLTGAAVTTATTNVYEVYPGLTASANSIANKVLPPTWRIKVTANNANAGTYSVGASLLP